MTIGVLGMRLQLLLGTAPMPASPDVVSALTSLNVTLSDAGRDGLQASFALSKAPGTDYTLLASGALAPMTRIIVVVIVGAMPETLFDGIITHHQIASGSGPNEATLTVSASDVSIAMDLEQKNQSYDNQPDFVIFSQLIGAYGQYGMVPTPTPTTVVPLMIERTPQQRATDFAYINQLAQRNGYVFYVEPLLPGTSTAYFGPPLRPPVAQRAISINMGEATNCESLSFSFDALAPERVQGASLETLSGTALPIASPGSLRLPPLSARPAEALRTRLLDDTSSLNPATGATTATATLTHAPEAVTGQGEMDTVRYGGLMRPRRIVGVRGMGFSYDGFYYVKSVTHTIRPGSCRQSFQLSRDGHLPLAPVVLP
jgi:hypothetical protein